MTTPAEIPFRQLLEALLDVDTPLHPRFLYRLSDLEDKELEMLKSAWLNIPAWRRKALLEDAETIGENDYLLSFEALARLALSDSEAQVRLPAVRTLWEYEDRSLVDSFRHILMHDAAPEVQAAAATALGKYVYLGEIEELPAETLRLIEDDLLQVTTGSGPDLIRRRALEALGYSSREEVAPLIESAYHAQDKDWLASALFAMGRSAHEGWRDKVLAQIYHRHPAVRAEAARAAGELEIRDAVPSLIELLDDTDSNVRAACIWSLSQIGGEGVREILEENYESASDEEEADYIEAALDNLAFTEDMQLFSLMDLPEGAEEGLDEGDLLDLFEDEEDLED